MSGRRKQSKGVGPSAITRSKRSRIDKGECGDGLSCSSCKKDIHVNADHVVLKPCTCVVCTSCLSKGHAKRGSHALLCPTCNEEVTSHRYISARIPDDDDTLFTECPYKGEPTAAEIKENLPKRCFQQQEEHNLNRLKVGESAAVLYSCKYTKTGTGWQRDTYVDTISQRIETEDEQEIYCSKFAQFMAFMHDLVALPSIIPEDKVKHVMPDDLLDYCVTRHRESPLLSSLFGLAAGYPKPEVDKITLETGDYVTFRSQFIAISVAEGMLLRSMSSYPGVFQLMLNEQLSMENISQPCLNLLSALRVMPCRKFTADSKCRTLIETWTKEIDNNKLHPLDLFMVNQDNLGMQQKSKQAANFQYTVFQDIVIRKEVLYDLNIYGNNRLSREKKSWKDLCSADKSTNTLAKRMIEVCDKAKEYHSEFVMEDIHTAIRLCMSGDIPGKVGGTITRLGRIVSNDVMSTLKSGPETAVDTSSSNENIEAISTRTISNDYLVGSGSMYRRKGTEITLHAIEENLSSESTIRMSADYVSNIRKKQLEEYDSNNEGEVPIANDIAIIMCDGAPCSQYMTLIAEDRNEDSEERSYPGFFSFFGGFHTLMKCANCNGEMFTNILTTFVGAWRNSSKKIEWFTVPSDPSQRMGETFQHSCCHNAAGARSLMEKFGSWPSAVEVNNLMLQRAEHYPICALVLLFLRCEVILEMLRASEKIGKRGCVELFMYCLKLAVPIFAVTHKTDYMRLVCDLLQWYECASPADKVIYNELIYTQVTSTGKSQWTDLFMEKTIGDIRSQVGRVARRGTSARIEHACEEMPKKRNQGDIMSGLRSGSTREAKIGRSKQDTKLFKDSALICGLPVIEEMQLWHHSAAPRFEEKGEIIELQEGDVRLPGGDTVNPEVLDFFRTGSLRAVNYMQFYNIDNPDKTSRSEKDVSLRRILPSVKERKSVLEKDIIAATSTDTTELEVLTVPELLVQIEETRQMLNSKGIKPQIKRKKQAGKKPEKKARLIELRKILFKMDKGAKEREKDEIIQQYKVNNEVFGENMKTILNDPLGMYAIHTNVLGKQRYKNAPDLNDESYVML